MDIEGFGYSSVDLAGLSYNRRSTSGNIFSFGSVVVSWSNKNQPRIDMSSKEVQYRGENMVASEIALLRKLL